MTTQTPVPYPTTDGISGPPLRWFLDNDKDYGDVPVSSFDDRRLNPFRPSYNADAAWRAFLNAPNRHDYIHLLCRWRLRYINPNTPTCDMCAVFGRDCSIGGDGDCQECSEDGDICGVVSLRSTSSMVQEYVRGRGYWWFTGVGKRACDACVAGDLDSDCDIWRDGGCLACSTSGANCLVRGEVPGSFAERMARREGHEERITDIRPEPRDSQRDLAYIYNLAIRNVPPVVEPYLPPKLAAAWGGLDMSARYYATLEQAHEGLRWMGMKFEAARTIGDPGMPRTAATACDPCGRANVGCSSTRAGITCDQCKFHRQECRWFWIPVAARTRVVCRECRAAGRPDLCDAEAPSVPAVWGKGCSCCRQLDQHCTYIAPNLNTHTLFPRPDGILRPMCCDQCLEHVDPIHPPDGIKSCSYRSDLAGPEQPSEPCEQCLVSGRVCTIGGRVFYAPELSTVVPVPPANSQTRPSHLFLTKNLPRERLRHQVEQVQAPREDVPVSYEARAGSTELVGLGGGGDAAEWSAERLANREPGWASVGLREAGNRYGTRPRRRQVRGAWDPETRTAGGRWLGGPPSGGTAPMDGGA
ncbi:hypothetical protein JX265_003722 [Neoarthrinium moseri]|uniref:Uncharacterized protein n=1 Tax=Neoarthrinium moseri TaxID=1658444 RepID=A0A9Q0ATS2_9PEZI|nr:hypothetical protein JX265_003722 [Neoarthrinium moseri]